MRQCYPFSPEADAAGLIQIGSTTIPKLFEEMDDMPPPTEEERKAAEAHSRAMARQPFQPLAGIRPVLPRSAVPTVVEEEDIWGEKVEVVRHLSPGDVVKEPAQEAANNHDTLIITALAGGFLFTVLTITYLGMIFS